MTTTQSTASDETQIRQLIAQWGQDREPLSTYKPFADLKDALQRKT